MFDYDEESKRAVEILDKYDLSPYLINRYGIDLFVIRENLINVLGKAVGDVTISNLSVDEFAEYLHQRYKARIEEVPVYYFWWNDREGNK